MNPYDPTFTAEFADGEYTFRLGNDQIYELEAKCGIGIFAIPFRLAGNAGYYNDVRETIRLGLIGGGADASTALRLVRSYIDNGSKIAAWALAVRILEVTLSPPEDLKKKAASPGQPDSASPPPTSTA